jgi:hypothetical protein
MPTTSCRAKRRQREIGATALGRCEMPYRKAAATELAQGRLGCAALGRRLDLGHVNAIAADVNCSRDGDGFPIELLCRSLVIELKHRAR